MPFGGVFRVANVLLHNYLAAIANVGPTLNHCAFANRLPDLLLREVERQAERVPCPVHMGIFRIRMISIECCPSTTDEAGAAGKYFRGTP